MSASDSRMARRTFWVAGEILRDLSLPILANPKLILYVRNLVREGKSGAPDH